MKFAILSLAAVGLAIPAAALAHHGWSGYEPDKLMTLEAPIQGVRYSNPHAEIDLTVNGQKWLVTLAPLQRMEMRGVTPAVLKVGQTVKVEGARSLTPGRFEIKAERISIDGKSSELRR
jgi:hypothetical protein